MISGTNRCEFMNNPFLKDVPESVWDHRYIYIERPKTPFPGQLFEGQRRPSALDADMCLLMNTDMIDRFANRDVRVKLWNCVKEEWNNNNGKLMEIIERWIPDGTLMSNDVLNNLRIDILENSYAKRVSMAFRELKRVK